MYVSVHFCLIHLIPASLHCHAHTTVWDNQTVSTVIHTTVLDNQQVENSLQFSITENWAQDCMGKQDYELHRKGGNSKGDFGVDPKKLTKEQ